MSVIGTNVTITLHAHHVQTCIRNYGKHGMEHVERTYVGATIPKKVMTCGNRAELDTLVQTLESDGDFDVRSEYLPNFPGFFEMKIVLPEDENFSTFVVTEARYIDRRKGGRSVKGAFDDPKFKTPILNNLLNLIENKDVEKLKQVLNALDTVGA